MTSPPSGPPPSGPPATAYNFNPNRLGRNDWVIGGASLVLLISLFLPWFSVTISGLGSATASGTTAHGYLWLVFIIALVVLALLALQAGLDRLPFSAPTAPQILAGATGLNALLILIAFLLKPPPSSAWGWSVGAFLGLIAALVAVGFAVLAVLPATSNR